MIYSNLSVCFVWLWLDHRVALTRLHISTRNISGLQRTISQILFSTMGSVPELSQAFVYLDFALDRMQQQLELMQGGSLEEMRKFINADTMLTLMTQAPEMLQTAMYTILTQPEKVRF